MDLNTLSAKELVIHFNKLVTERHITIPCITVWKASKAALIEKINALPATPVVGTRDEILSGGFETDPAAKAALENALANDGGEEVIADKPTRPAKVVKEKPAKADKADVAKGQSGNEVSEFFAANDLNPKVMRSKLRRAGFNAPYTLEQVKSVMK